MLRRPSHTGSHHLASATLPPLPWPPTNTSTLHSRKQPLPRPSLFAMPALFALVTSLVTTGLQACHTHLVQVCALTVPISLPLPTHPCRHNRNLPTIVLRHYGARLRHSHHIASSPNHAMTTMSPRCSTVRWAGGPHVAEMSTTSPNCVVSALSWCCLVAASPDRTWVKCVLTI